jgi:sigma-B regulation protein RsbU (phosphoserine phosphatase)
MTDSSLRFKDSKNTLPKGVKGSLAIRIFVITLIFLVTPLLVYCAAMYLYDTEAKKAQEGQILQLISEIQISMFEELVQEEFQILDLTTLEASNFLDKKISAEVFKSFLDEVSDFRFVKEIALLEKVGLNGVKCTMSSGQHQVTGDFKAQFFAEELKNNDAMISLIGLDSPDPMLMFIRVVKRSEQGEVFQTINLFMPTQMVMKYLTKAHGDTGQYQIALFTNQDFRIFNSQDSTLIGKQIVFQEPFNQTIDSVFLEKISNVEDTYEYIDGGKKVYATILPIANKHFSILILANPYQEDAYLKKFSYQMMLLLICIVIFGSLGTLVLTYLMGDPLKQLCYVMKEVGSRRLQARYKSSRYGFEINHVGEMFNQTIEDVVKHLHRIEVQTIQNERLKKELFIGQEIQKSLVPTHLLEIAELEFESLLIPAKEVGGDFYDFFVNPLNQDEIFLVMADTSGHGVFGCFYALTMRSILRSLGSTLNNLYQIITQSNAIFYKDSLETQVFVTTWIGSYNYKTKHLSYSSCGHPLGFVFRNNKLFKELSTPGIALGVLETIQPVIENVQLQSGDIVILITDGVIETHNCQNQMFGRKRFIETVEQFCHLPIKGLSEKIIFVVEEFEETSDNQEDDFTMLLVKIK